MHELSLKRVDFEALATDILAAGHTLHFRAQGTSMLPFIRGGDVLEVVRVPLETIRRGDVVLYRGTAGRMVAHRVVSAQCAAGQVMLATQGDALTSGDGVVPGEQVLGRVVAVQRGRRRILLECVAQRCQAQLWGWLSPVGRRFYHVVMALRRSLPLAV